MINDHPTRTEFEALQNRVTKVENVLSLAGTVAPAAKKGESRREIFMDYSLAKSHPDKLLVVMSILDNEKGEKGFNVDDIRAAYKSVKEKLPVNLSDTIAKLEKKGYISVLFGEKKFRVYSVTNSGAVALEALKREKV